MKTNYTAPKSPGMQIITAGMALTCGILLAGPAHADVRGRGGRGGGDRDWHHHEVAAHRYWHGRPAYGEVYAPPVVYEPPPVEQSPGFNLVLPIHIH